MILVHENNVFKTNKRSDNLYGSHELFVLLLLLKCFQLLFVFNASFVLKIKKVEAIRMLFHNYFAWKSNVNQW